MLRVFNKCEYIGNVKLFGIEFVMSVNFFLGENDCFFFCIKCGYLDIKLI